MARKILNNTVLNVAIVGCGWVAGSQMANGFAQLPDQFRVTIACDSDSGRATEFAARYGIESISASIEDVLCDPSVDVVSICTPPALHFEMVSAALLAGKHVVCEKPFTSSLERMDKVIELERQCYSRVMPIFQYRFFPGFQRVRRILRSGIAGKCYIASVETAWKRGADYYSVPWRGKFATELGGVLLTQSIHIHDLFLDLCGPVAEVKAFKTTRVNPIEVEDCAVAALRMADGSLASLTATLGSQRPTTRIRLCFENLTVERLSFDDEAPRPGEEPWSITPRDESVAKAIAAIPTPSASLRSFAAQFSGFYDVLAQGGDMPVTLADARRSLELVTALFHASEMDETVTLPIGCDHSRYSGWVTSLSPAGLPL